MENVALFQSRRQTFILLKILSQSFIWCPSPSRFPRTEGKNAVASSSCSTTATPSTYSLSSSLTIIHNSSNLALGFIQTHRIPIFFFCITRTGNGNAGSGDNLLLAVPTVDQRLRRMGFYLLIHWGGLFQMRLGTIDNTTMSTVRWLEPCRWDWWKSWKFSCTRFMSR